MSLIEPYFIDDEKSEGDAFKTVIEKIEDTEHVNITRADGFTIAVSTGCDETSLDIQRCPLDGSFWKSHAPISSTEAIERVDRFLRADATWDKGLEWEMLEAPDGPDDRPRTLLIWTVIAGLVMATWLMWLLAQ